MRKASRKKIEKGLAAKSDEPVLTKEMFLSTGLTTLNMGLTGNPFRGWAKGLIFLVVGDSSSGKTWLTMTAMAEASINPNFADYQFIYDPSENGRLMQVDTHFGPALAERFVEPPNGPSTSLEAFYDNLTDAMKQGPCIFVEDSMDALMTLEEMAQSEKERNARRGGPKAGGNYGVSKAKLNSSKLREANNRIKETGSILFVVSQTRQNIGYGAQFAPKTRSGGDSLTFYNRAEVWLSRKEKLKQDVSGKKIVIGQVTKAKIQKNHLSGWEGEVDIPFYRKVGIDDVGACIDYLVEWDHWKKVKGIITAAEFDLCTRREQLAKSIQDREEERTLQKLTSKVWKQIDAAATINRRSRYAPRG